MFEEHFLCSESFKDLAQKEGYEFIGIEGNIVYLKLFKEKVVNSSDGPEFNATVNNLIFEISLSKNNYSIIDINLCTNKLKNLHIENFYFEQNDNLNISYYYLHPHISTDLTFKKCCLGSIIKENLRSINLFKENEYKSLMFLDLLDSFVTTESRIGGPYFYLKKKYKEYCNFSPLNLIDEIYIVEALFELKLAKKYIKLKDILPFLGEIITICLSKKLNNSNRNIYLDLNKKILFTEVVLDKIIKFSHLLQNANRSIIFKEQQRCFGDLNLLNSIIDNTNPYLFGDYNYIENNIILLNGYNVNKYKDLIVENLTYNLEEIITKKNFYETYRYFLKLEFDKNLIRQVKKCN